MTNAGECGGHLIFVSEKESAKRRSAVACEEASSTPSQSTPDCEACSV